MPVSYRDLVAAQMPPGTQVPSGLSLGDVMGGGRLGMGDLLMAEQRMAPNPYAPNPYSQDMTDYLGQLTAADIQNQGAAIPPWLPYLPPDAGTLVPGRTNWESGSRDVMGNPLPPPYSGAPYPRLPVPAPAPYYTGEPTGMMPQIDPRIIQNLAMNGTLGALMGGTGLTQRLPLARERYDAMNMAPTPGPVTPFEQDPLRVYPEASTGPIGVTRGASYSQKLPLARDRAPGMTLPPSSAPAGKERKFKKVRLARDRD